MTVTSSRATTRHDFRHRMWGHNIASVTVERHKRLFRQPKTLAKGTCWTYQPVRVGDELVYRADAGDIVVKLTTVQAAPTVRDMSFWEGVIIAIEEPGDE